MIALLTAASVALVVSLVGTRLLIPFLLKRGVGQPIQIDGPEGHRTKEGTPTMGGGALVAGAFAGYLVSHLRAETVFTRSGLTLMGAVVAATAVGLLDDMLKVVRERNLGLTKRAKSIGLLVVGVGFALASLNWVGVEGAISLTRLGFPELNLAPGAWVLWAVLVVMGTSNAVNLTDGLDGLASGAATLAFAAFVAIGYWGFRHPEIYDVKHALDLAIIAAAMAGACVGFLWWNAPPAKIFMGDAGSLALGTALAGLALLLRTDLLLVLIGGLYVIETLSVIAQVSSFRLFNKRVLRMAPIHHHFELGGWPETTVLIRMWVINGFLVAVALGIYYADFLSIDSSVQGVL